MRVATIGVFDTIDPELMAMCKWIARGPFYIAIASDELTSATNSQQARVGKAMMFGIPWVFKNGETYLDDFMERTRPDVVVIPHSDGDAWLPPGFGELYSVSLLVHHPLDNAPVGGPAATISQGQTPGPGAAMVPGSMDDDEPVQD